MSYYHPPPAPSHFQSICQILWREWDPIGINHCPQAADEYDGYAGGIDRMLAEGVDESQLCQYLHQVRTQAMGLSHTDADTERDCRAARRLLDLIRRG